MDLQASTFGIRSGGLRALGCKAGFNTGVS